MWFDYLVTAAVVASIFANFPLIYRICKTKNTKSLSLLSSWLWVIIATILTIHGYLINDIAFTISNGGILFVQIVILKLIYKYR